MGCGASADNHQGSRPSSATSSRRGLRYQKIMADADNDAGEFEEIQRVDVTSAEFQRALPIAPFSFSRPEPTLNPAPSIPCYELEQLLSFAHAGYWERCGKRRQLYRCPGPSRTQNPTKWVFYNDSYDLNCIVKIIFDPATGHFAQEVDILNSTYVTKSVRDEFVTFAVMIEPLQTIAALQIPTSVPTAAYMVVYDAQEYTRGVGSVKARESSTNKRESKCRALEQLLERSKIPLQERTDLACVKLCVSQHVMFVDRSVDPDAESCEYLSPDHFLLPVECDEVRPFRAALKMIDVRKQHLYCRQAKYVNLADALYIISKRPEIIQRIFRHPSSSQDCLKEWKIGAFRLTICDDSLFRREVIVDNYFHVDAGKYVGIFRDDPCEVWPQLIVKGLLKLHDKVLASFFDRSTISFVEQISGAVSHTFVEWKTKFGDGDPVVQGYQLQQWLSRGHIIAFSDTEHSTLLLLEHVYVIPARKCCLLRLSHPLWKVPQGSQLASASRWGDTSKSILESFPEVANEIRRSKPQDDDWFVSLADIDGTLCEMIACFHQPPEFNARIRGSFNGLRPHPPSVSLSITTSRTVEMCFSLRISFAVDRQVLLSIFSCTGEEVFGGALRYELLCNSSRSAAKQSMSRFSFSLHSCTLRVRLEASKTPYLVVPRLLGDDESAVSFRPAEHGHVGKSVLPGPLAVAAEVPFTLIVESEADLSNGVDIKLRSVDRESKIFDSVDSVIVGNATSVVASATVQSFDRASIFNKDVSDFSFFVK